MGRPGIAAVPTAGAKGDVGHLRFPMSPLDTPLTFRRPLSKAFAAKRGRRGLGSVRRAGFGTLSGPEVSLRKPPRITVRDRRESRPKEGLGCQEGKGNHRCPVPSCLRRQTVAMPRHIMANIPRPGRVILASSGAPLYRRNLSHSVEGKEKGRTAVSAEITPLLRGKEKRTHIRAADKSLIL